MTETSTERREGLLRKVRGLVAKADSTPFEGEADAFRAKAQELMDRYMIEEWELAQRTGDLSALRPIRKDMDMSWWHHEDGPIADALWSLLLTLSTHCNVVLAHRNVYSERGVFEDGVYRSQVNIPVFGTEQDIAFLDMLFTSLMTQMLAKFKPVYHPDESLGSNIARAKEVGMKYADIAVWLGHPEWSVHNNGKSNSPIMLREYKKFAKAHGIEVNSVSPKTYIRSYAAGFVGAIRERLRKPEESTGTMALAVRDAYSKAQAAMFEEFPDQARKSKALAHQRRQYSYAGAARGAAAGHAANITSRDGGLGKTKEIN